MRSTLQRIALLAIFTVLAGCDHPTDPAPADDHAPQLGAYQEAGSGVIAVDGYLDPGVEECVGEALVFSFAVPYSYHLVVTPNGDVRYLEHLRPADAAGTAVGAVSGTTFTLVNYASPFILHSGPGEMTTYTGTYRWVSEEGAAVMFHFRLHLLQDDAGDVRVETAAHSCALR
jgi:hypothetical protein